MDALVRAFTSEDDAMEVVADEGDVVDDDDGGVADGGDDADEDDDDASDASAGGAASDISGWSLVLLSLHPTHKLGRGP